MTEWTRRTQQQAYRFRNVPQLTAVEYAVTSCCETVMEAINIKLDEHKLELIPIARALDDSDLKTQRTLRLGIYVAVQSIVAQEVLARGQVEDKPLISAASNVLKRVAKYSLIDMEGIFNHFINTHPQLKQVPELATPQLLGQFVQPIVQEEIRNWLHNKPTRPINKPESGRSI